MVQIFCMILIQQSLTLQKLRMCYDFRVLEMGCYGLGVSRILQASVEVLTDGKHIRWPKLIAPYQIIIIPQKVTIILIFRRKNHHL